MLDNILYHIRQVRCKLTTLIPLRRCETKTTSVTTCSGIPQLYRVKKQKTGSQTGVSFSSREHMASVLSNVLKWPVLMVCWLSLQHNHEAPLVCYGFLFTLIEGSFWGAYTMYYFKKHGFIGWLITDPNSGLFHIQNGCLVFLYKY